MKKTDKNLYLLYMIMATGLVTANCIASKVFIMPFSLFGSAVTLTTGAICYPLTFLVTDIIGELWGREKANIAVRWGFVVQLISTAIIVIARYLPATEIAMQDSYVNLLGQNWVFVLASLIAYTISQHWDVWVFHSIRDRYIKKHGSTKGGKWIWNNVGTCTSQMLDSVIYVVIAFGFGFGWLFDSSMHSVMINMIIGQILVKVIIALLDTPIFYLCTRGSSNDHT